MQFYLLELATRNSQLWK